MAGMAKRLRPLSLTTPKPLFYLAGKSILERIILSLCPLISISKITDVIFIVSSYDDSIQALVKESLQNYNFKINFVVQQKPLGTAHALYQAKDYLSDEILVIFADTLFYVNSKYIDLNSDLLIFTSFVDNPSSYGVVVKENNKVVNLIEKPAKFLSNEAIIGIYYFKDGVYLKNKISYIVENELYSNGELQLTDALKFYIEDNLSVKSFPVDIWLDCGTIPNILKAHNYILNINDFDTNDNIVANNSVIIPPVYLGNNVIVENSIIGPFVSIEDNCIVKSSIISDTIVYNNSHISNIIAANSFIGKNCVLTDKQKNFYLSDYASYSSI